MWFPGTDSARRDSELARRHRQIYTRHYHRHHRHASLLSNSMFTCTYADPTQLKSTSVLTLERDGDDGASQSGQKGVPYPAPTTLPFPNFGSHFSQPRGTIERGRRLLSSDVSVSSCHRHVVPCHVCNLRYFDQGAIIQF